MCFRFGSCFGVHVHDHDDECYAPPPAASKAVPGPVPPRHAAATKSSPAMRNGYHYSNGHHPQQGLHRGDAHHQQARAGDADRRNMPSAAAAVAATCGHGYAAGAREQAHGYATGADEASKRPASAWIDKVAHGVGIGNGAQYYYYPTAATATSEHERC